MNKTKTANAKLLQKASAIKFGWLAMEISGSWCWFSKKPRWCMGGYWFGLCNDVGQYVKFLRLPKRSPSFAPLSLIKCTPRGPILLSIGKMYHKTWGMIDSPTGANAKKGVR